MSVVISHSVPSIAPRGLQADRINGTHMSVAWEPLTLVEARGIILNYTVSYTPTDRAGQTLTVSADSDQDHIPIGDLYPFQASSFVIT